MSIFLERLSAQDEQRDGFFDGRQKLIPDGTELEVTVVSGFFGQREGAALMSAELNIVVTERGEFFGQIHMWRPKVYDMNEQRSEIARKNLALFDFFVGYPIASGGHPLTDETIAHFWAGKAKAIALFRTNESMLAKEREANAKKREAAASEGKPIPEEVKTDDPRNWIGGFKRAVRQVAPPVTLQQPQQFAPQQVQQEQVQQFAPQQQQQQQQQPQYAAQQVQQVQQVQQQPPQKLEW